MQFLVQKGFSSDAIGFVLLIKAEPDVPQTVISKKKLHKCGRELIWPFFKQGHLKRSFILVIFKISTIAQSEVQVNVCKIMKLY